MVTRYIQEASRRAEYKRLADGTYFGEIPGLAGVWANEATAKQCRVVLQEVLGEWLVLKIRDHDEIPRLGRVRVTVLASVIVKAWRFISPPTRSLAWASLLAGLAAHRNGW